MAMWGSLFKKGKSMTRRFVFHASAIATLKSQATSLCVKHPTRLEVVSAFIWKHAMAASRENYGFQKPSLLTHLVNLRRRMASPLSEHSIGNLLWIAAAQCTNKDHDQVGLQGLVGEIRGAISRIDCDFVQKLQGHEEIRNSVMCESLKEIGEVGSKDEVYYFGFSSWCNLGFLNLTILVDTQLGDGIEAWVTLDEQDMARLVCNSELLTFASLDPSPLI